MKNVRLSVVALIVALFCLVSSAFAGYLTDNFDLGDIEGGYSTQVSPNYSGTGSTSYLYMYVNGQDKIQNSGVSFYPMYNDVFDPSSGSLISQTITGYSVNAYVMGHVTSRASSDASSLNQSNSFNARGLVLSENSWLDCYSPFNNGDLSANGLFAEAGSNLNISNFQVTNANGNYNEFSFPAGMGLPDTTYFQYNVSWQGNFAPGTLAPNFVAPAMSVSTEAVPEPSTFVLLGVGALGLGIAYWRKRRYPA